MKKRTNYICATLSLLLLVFLILLLRNDNLKRAEKATEIMEYNNNEEKEQKFITETINNEMSGVICWGDSLTAGSGGGGVTYPLILEKLINDNIYEIPVINEGVGGEGTNEILGRSGAVPFVVDAFTIPNDTSQVEISFKSQNGNGVSPLRRDYDGGINPCIINGVEGKISSVLSDAINIKYTYYFQRSVEGDEVSVKNGTQIITEAFRDYKEYIPIIFIGQNGGFSDVNDLVNQIKSFLSLNPDNDKYLVLGLTSGTSESRAVLEETMENEFGDKYINLREYISKYGMSEAKLTATSEDKKAMSEGSIPPSLIAEGVHFNSYGYEIIGNLVYDRMNELGYFNKIIKVLKNN